MGWITNYLAVRMLFHPRREVRILWIPIQGVFPRRQAAFAKKLAQLVAQKLFSTSELTARFKSKAASPERLDQVLSYMQDLIIDRVPKMLPIVGAFIQPGMVRELLDGFRPDLERLLSQLSDQIAQELEQEVDIEQLVEEKIAAFSSDKIEEIILSIMSSELKFVELVGGVLGFFVGTIQAVFSYSQW